MKCKRCGEPYAVANKYDFCISCLKTFNAMMRELKSAFMRQHYHQNTRIKITTVDKKNDY